MIAFLTLCFCVPFTTCIYVVYSTRASWQAMNISEQVSKHQQESDAYMFHFRSEILILW